jgi:hypothetical protein
MSYEDVQNYVRKRHGYVAKTCWIAHAKELCGLPVRKAHHRTGRRAYPCPPDKLKDIKEAFRHVGWV